MHGINTTTGIDGQARQTGTSVHVRPTGKPTAKKLRQLVDYQNGLCALSGRTLSPENCEVDHIVPVSEGGENEMENLQLVVSEANQSKRAMSQEAFVRLCEDVARYQGEW